MRSTVLALGDICDFVYGAGLPESKREGGDVPVYGSNGFVGLHNRAITTGPTIIIGRKGSIGEVHFSNVSCWPIDTTYYIDKTKIPCNIRWLFYGLLTLNLPAMNKAAAVPGLNRTDAYEESLFSPSIPEQERIAAILDKADRLRHLRRYALKLSNTYLQSVFMDMFGDPVVNLKGWKESPLDEVVAKVKFAIADGPFGSDLKADEYTDEGVRVIKVNNIKPNEFNFDDVCHVSLTKYQSIKRSTVRSGDVVMAKVGNTIGKTCVFPDSIQYAVLTANVCKMTLNTQIALPWFISYQMNLDGIQQRIRGLSGDTAKPMINIPKLRELKLILPDIPKQQEYVDIVLRHKRLRVQQREALRQAEHLFQTLLHRAFRGELS